MSRLSSLQQLKAERRDNAASRKNRVSESTLPIKRSPYAYVLSCFGDFTHRAEERSPLLPLLNNDAGINAGTGPQIHANFQRTRDAVPQRTSRFFKARRQQFRERAPNTCGESEPRAKHSNLNNVIASISTRILTPTRVLTLWRAS